MKDPKWAKAMNEELEVIQFNKTWDITTLPLRKVAVGFKWLYKNKYNPDGTLERHKARLVVLGNKQKYGMDYKTFVPVPVALKNNGFLLSKSDYSLFKKKKEGATFTSILVYVDDLIIAGNNEDAISDAT